jgi:hypothetical protein
VTVQGKKKRGRVTEEFRAWSTVGLASFFFFFSFYSCDFIKTILQKIFLIEINLVFIFVWLKLYLKLKLNKN